MQLLFEAKFGDSVGKLVIFINYLTKYIFVNNVVIPYNNGEDTFYLSPSININIVTSIIHLHITYQ